MVLKYGNGCFCKVDLVSEMLWEEGCFFLLGV